MKFATATLSAPVTLESVMEDETREFPAGHTVSVILPDGPAAPTHYHLNANGGGGTWDTFAGYAPADAVQVGEVIATCNEG